MTDYRGRKAVLHFYPRDDTSGCTLAADPERQVLEKYGVRKEKSMHGRKYMGVERTMMLIGPDERIWRKVSVPGHAAEVLEAARAVG